MINIEEAKNVFKEYVKAYDPEDGKIALKIGHILRVTEKSREIAENLNLEAEDINLAELIGLLHDIGRFEQVRIYNTFYDKDSINHGEYGVKILFEDNLIRKFIQDDCYDEIIKKAILNHNKPRIEEGLTDRELMHAKIIRDADKLDIYYVLLTEKLENSYGCKDFSKDKITDEIYREFKENHMIDYKNLKTNADLLVAHIAYIFDFYYNYSLNIVKENNYIEKIEQKVNLQDEQAIKYLEKINVIANEYIEECLKN